MYYVYILQNKQRHLYKGITNNIVRRLNEHNLNKSVGTRRKGPWKLVHVEICINGMQARKLEKYFKSGTGRELLKELIK